MKSSLVPGSRGAEVELEQPSPESGHLPITSAHTSRESSPEEPLMSNAQLHRYKLTVSNGPNQKMHLDQVEAQSSPLISATASSFTLQPSQINLLDSPTSVSAAKFYNFHVFALIEKFVIDPYAAPFGQRR